MPWDCYYVDNFYGWEAEKVVVVTTGSSIMELITRARTCLSVLLVENGSDYTKIKDSFHQAADLGLVEVVQLTSDDQADKEFA